MILEVPKETMEVIKQHCGHDIEIMPNIVGCQVTCRDCDAAVARFVISIGNDKPGFPVFHDLPISGIDQVMAHRDCIDIHLSEYPHGELVVACEECQEVFLEFQEKGD